MYHYDHALAVHLYVSAFPGGRTQQSAASRVDFWGHSRRYFQLRFMTIEGTDIFDVDPLKKVFQYFFIIISFFCQFICTILA